MQARIPRRRYRDPLDEVWLAAARRIGFRIARTPHAYATTEGDGTIAIGTAEVLDVDDCLAQMILHELCHALVEGEESFSKPDWGLDNQTMRDESREQACLRTQAALLAPHGLRGVLAPTTDHREFYDRLPDDPLADDAPSVLARTALGRAGRPPFAPHLEHALEATATIVRAAARFASPGQVGEEMPSLHAAYVEPAGRHETGFPLRAGDERCGGCAWRFVVRGVSRCRQAKDARIDAGARACDRWEPEAIDCQDCGACCRAAYDSVTVNKRDPVVRRHPELIVVRETYLELRREGDRCAALGHEGRSPLDERYGCRIYADRPRTCRDFEWRGAHCLHARRRVGLSR
jgi:hypothetical protein